jgi:putative heme-binding domain-containing protein
VGTDGSSIGGYGDGGNVMRCRLDGSELEEIATGFWNPFDLKFTDNGRLMLTDNDPDSRGPNRLIEIVPGGDYGYKSLYGGTGLHPYVSWNGELPGTLPYAAPLGEAPCSLLDGNFTNFGESYGNSILVNVWEEKNIVHIPLKSSGSSVSGKPEILVQGDITFHPVAMAANSRGEVFITDWVLREYPNHGAGNIWRLSSRNPSTAHGKYSPDQYRFKADNQDLSQLRNTLNFGDAFEKSMARVQMQSRATDEELLDLLHDSNNEKRLQSLLIFSMRPRELSPGELNKLLVDEDSRIRKATLIYIGTRHVQIMREQLGQLLRSGEITPDLFETYLATIQNLQPDFVQGYHHKTELTAKNLKRELPENFILNVIKDDGIDESMRGLALPYLPTPENNKDLLVELLTTAKNESFQLSLIAAINSIRNHYQESDNIESVLLVVAGSKGNSERVRSNALTALFEANPTSMEAVQKILFSSTSTIQYAAIKYLCNFAGAPQIDVINQWIKENSSSLDASVVSVWNRCHSNEGDSPAMDQWQTAVNGHGNPERGELVFKSRTSQCQTCHKVDGWGGIFGPDLSHVGSSKGQPGLITAILYPSQEMAPEWQGWFLIDQEGNRHVGRQIDVNLNFAKLMNIKGSFDTYKNPKSYGVTDKSVMPEGLQNQMTLEEFNDLIAYLVSLK